VVAFLCGLALDTKYNLRLAADLVPRPLKATLGIQMQELLLEHKAKKNLISIERKDIDQNNIQAFILSASSNLVLIQYLYDFKIDGIMVLRMSDISDINCSNTDKFQLQLLKDEKIYDQINLQYNCDLKNWKTAISDLRRDYDYFILEDENKDDPIFLIGKIEKMTSRSVHLNYFSGAGNWYKKLSVIKYNDLTACQVDTNYINVYKRYFERIS
jgi:hypothetical protein